jgi:uncharacterized protein with HEPN domain
MQPKSPKWLEDIANACTRIEEYTLNVTLSEFRSDDRTRQAVERNLEIIGEALLRLERVDGPTAKRINDYRQIIGLRNRLAHEYDDIDDERVWDFVQRSIPLLKSEALELVREAEVEFDMKSEENPGDC